MWEPAGLWWCSPLTGTNKYITHSHTCRWEILSSFELLWLLSSQSWGWIIIVLTKQTFKHRSQANMSMIHWENRRQPKHAMAPWASSRAIFLITYYCRISCFTVNGVVFSENGKRVNWSWAKKKINCCKYLHNCKYNYYRLAIFLFVYRIAT